MAIGALHQVLVHAVAEGLGKLRPRFVVARIAQVRLFFGQQELLFFRVMHGVAINAAHVVGLMRGTRKTTVLRVVLMAGQAGFRDFGSGKLLRHHDFRLIAAPGHVIRSGPVAGYAALLPGLGALAQGGFPVRSLFEIIEKLIVASFASL